MPIFIFTKIGIPLENDTKKNNRIGKKEYKFRQKLLTFLFFLVLAFVFWLLNALNHDYSTNIRFPIKYIYSLSDKEMTNRIPDEIVLNVSAHGYTLLRNQITARNNPILFRVISLNFTEISRDSGKYLLLTRTLHETIQRQLGDQVTLNYISPDSLIYYFSPVIKKKIAIRPNIEVEFEKQFMQGGDIILQPDSTIVTGPAVIIDTLKQVNTVYKKVLNISKAFTLNLPLEKVDNLRFFPENTTIVFPVEKYTETTLMVPIMAINMPDSLYLKTFPSFVKLNLLVSLQNYNKLAPELFSAVVDYNSTFSRIRNKIKVRIVKQPSFVKVNGFTPLSVEYIIEK